MKEEYLPFDVKCPVCKLRNGAHTYICPNRKTSYKDREPGA